MSEEQKNKDKEEKNKKYKVLILDDDEFLLQMYALKFQKMNFDVDTATNGNMAMTKLKEGHFDVMLADVVLPEMDGFEIVEKIKKEKISPSTAIIMLTNQNQPTDIDKGKALGVDGYIVKASAIPSEVVSRVKEILEGRKKG